VATLLPGVAAVGGRLGVIVAAALALVLLGMADDRCRLGAGTKLLGQVVVAAAVAAWGVRITFFCPIPLVTWTVTAFWLLLIINAINFLDNMDGLAAGTGAIAALLFAFVAGLREQHFVALLSAVTCGSACGFLVFNRPPASIFMGDAGSHLLGFLLAVIGALTTFYAPGETLAGPMSQTHAPVLIPLLVLAIPIFDLAAVVFIRARQHRPVYVGDHQHISHRFEGMGLSRPQSVLQVHLLGLAIGAGAVLLLWLPLTGVLVVLLQAAAMITLVTLLHTRRFGGRTPVAPPAPAATSDRLEERADSARSVPP
jgi:UDP-GlcNAc:undecaprenyl-phosphate GlcNAc-1-phosphate transferase